MIKKLSSEQFKTFYNRMFEEFPESEMKSLEDFVNLLDEGKYICLGYYDEDILRGYALGCLTSKEFFWLDYLHIFKENQNGGYGSKLLNAILNEVAKKGIFLETEVLDTDDYHDIKQRRMRFYDRFNIHQVDCNYLFPCADGTYIDSLNLKYIPAPGVTRLNKEEIQEVIRESVGTIHKALPHSKEVMNKYIDEVKDLEIHRFSLTDVNMDDDKELEDIGRLIYYTDPYVYPAFYDNDIELSKQSAKALLSRNTLFNHSNIKVGRIDGKVAGFMVILESYPKDNRKEMENAFQEVFGKFTPRFYEVMEGYYDTLDYEWEGIQIMSLAVLPEFRKMRVATKMLNSLPSKNTYSLACVKDNTKARELYRKCGFKFKFEYPGFTGIMCVELVRKGK